MPRAINFRTLCGVKIWSRDPRNLRGNRDLPVEVSVPRAIDLARFQELAHPPPHVIRPEVLHKPAQVVARRARNRDSCITQIKAQGPSRTCDEEKTCSYWPQKRIKISSKLTILVLNHPLWNCLVLNDQLSELFGYFRGLQLRNPLQSSAVQGYFAHKKTPIPL